jgi:death-on-curing protein
VRDRQLLDAALARPLASFAGELLYGNPFARAGALMHSMLENQPFASANTAVAILAAGFWLEREGYRLDADQHDLLQTALATAAGALDVDDLARWLRERAVRLDR